jgi:hypothetical protein
VRIGLIVGAAYCLAISLWQILLKATYHSQFDPFSTRLMLGGFIPIILLTPRSTTPKKRLFFGFIGFMELFVIGAFHLWLFVERY